MHYRDFDHPWVRGAQFHDTNLTELTQWVVDKCGKTPKTSEKPRAWVFDLDSTLFCVSGRFRRVFEKFLKLHPEIDSRVSRVLPWITSENHQYSVRDNFKNYLEKGLEGDTKTVQELIEKYGWEFRQFWEDEFFCDHHVVFDSAYEGSPEFVNRIRELDFSIVYLTARDQIRSLKGTQHALKTNGFPTDSKTHLIMKPAPVESDLEFKNRACTQLNAQFDVVATIDNEPENLAIFSQNLLKAEIVFFHSIMSRRIPSPESFSALGARRLWRLESF